MLRALSQRESITDLTIDELAGAETEIPEIFHFPRLKSLNIIEDIESDLSLMRCLNLETLELSFNNIPGAVSNWSFF